LRKILFVRSIYHIRYIETNFGIFVCRKNWSKRSLNQNLAFTLSLKSGLYINPEMPKNWPLDLAFMLSPKKLACMEKLVFMLGPKSRPYTFRLYNLAPAGHFYLQKTQKIFPNKQKYYKKMTNRYQIGKK